jgi:hypothetical protein
MFTFSGELLIRLRYQYELYTKKGLEIKLVEY